MTLFQWPPYVLLATDSSPKKFRFTFTLRMQNLAMDIIEDLYLANETFVKRPEQYEKRRAYINILHQLIIKFLNSYWLNESKIRIYWLSWDNL